MSGQSATGTGFRLAVGTLTVIPVGDIGEITPRVARIAMVAAPVAALPLALGAGLGVWLGGLIGLPSLITGALVCGWLGLATRGMHLDGLADTVDALAAGWSRERALEVMRRGDVGPLGAAALVIVLLAQAAAVGALAGTPLGWLLVGWAVIAARVACAALTVRGLRPARPDGLGAAVANVVPPVWLSVSALVIAALGAGVVMLVGHWWLPLVGVLVAGCALGWLARTALRVFGGINGDVIGAGVELTSALLLVVLTIGVGG